MKHYRSIKTLVLRMGMAASLCSVAPVMADHHEKAESSEFGSVTIDLGVVVSDLEKSVAFYTEAIGFKDSGGFGVPAGFAKDAGLTAEKPLDIKVLTLGDGPGATKLKLMQVSGVDSKSSDNEFIHSQLGYSYITIVVKSTDNALKRLKKAGIAPIAKSPATLPKNLNPALALTVVRDPDGNLVELVGPKPRDKKAPQLDAKTADEDYAVQGEYVGTIGDYKVGAHVIAQGDGKFNVVGYMGGLPGAGWNGNRDERRLGKGETKDGKTTFVGDENWTAELKDGELIVSDDLGNEVGTLERIVRKSETLGAKAPEGAVVLFDGTSADAFEKGRVSPEGWLEKGVTSKQRFGDFKLHVEFILPYQPYARGQGRGNSGFYAHGRYEVQMLDSFGLDGKHNECGGIYSVKEPDVNMCFPPLQWQTYDVDFTGARFDADGKKIANARMTVKHNGIVVHDNVEVDHATTASPLKEGPEPGPVYFQDHGNPVRYRNIWLVEKK